MSLQNVSLCVPRASSGLDPTQPVIAVSPHSPHEIPPNHVVIRVDRFGFSANNVTYQALGEAPNFRYFEFHDVPEAEGLAGEKYGMIPVWGFGTVVSTSSEIKVGERVYGYFAPARFVLVGVDPASINRYSFLVPRPHLPADRKPYNQINRCAGDPLYDAAEEDLAMLYRPLFWTSFWCEDWLFHGTDVPYRGATRFIISSASAKTAFASAYCLKRRFAKDPAKFGGAKIIGLTSKRNVDFTKGLGLYDVVLEYSTFAESEHVNVQGDEKWVFLDVAGNDDLNHRLNQHFIAAGAKSKLVAAVMLGVTTLAPAASTKASSVGLMTLPDAASTDSAAAPVDEKLKLETFFTVEWLTYRRAHSLTVEQIATVQAEAWGALMKDGRGWVRLERVYGPDNVKREYEKIGKQGLGPEVGQIWSLWEKEEEEVFELEKANL